VGRDFTLSGKEFHNFIVEGKKDLELVCRRHLSVIVIIITEKKLNFEKVGRDFTLSGKEFHNFIVEGKKDLELVCRRHL
jgi:5S rRNA maturation endonuclease (ribonuclease M5)